MVDQVSVFGGTCCLIWNVALYSVVDLCQCLEEPTASPFSVHRVSCHCTAQVAVPALPALYYTYFPPAQLTSSALKVEAAGPFEMFVPIKQTTWCHMP